MRGGVRWDGMGVVKRKVKSRDGEPSGWRGTYIHARQARPGPCMSLALQIGRAGILPLREKAAH